MQVADAEGAWVEKHTTGDPIMTTRTPIHTGGCQCGAVRFAFFAAPTSVTICHCRMCQKALGNYFGPYASIALTDFAWTRGTPKIFRSSAKARRGFCGDCGTPLSFEFEGGKTTSLIIGAFDDPAALPPEKQIVMESAVPYLSKIAGLPTRVDPTGTATRRVAIAASNCQHPDHDTSVWPLKDKNP